MRAVELAVLLLTDTLPVLPARALVPHARPRALFLRMLALVALGALLYVGWVELQFLTDDAFITFRYIDHHRRGWGYVWNPPPFRPVEGYSNFLWAVILEGVWVVTGATPPAAANVVSLLFSAGSLVLGFLLVYRAAWPGWREPARFWVASASLLYPLTHRSFLTWTSSGLETALFGFCALLWIFGAVELGRRKDVRSLALTAVGASAASLTRPDGLLLLGTTGVLALWLALDQRRLRDAFIGLTPLAAVAVHLLWRRAFYGDWVPNTYHAKVVSAWPEAGLRYTGSFILEHAVWAWALVPLVVAARWLLRLRGQRPTRAGVIAALPVVLVTLTLLGHVAYYTFRVGGDHFEYRVLTHLVVPMGVALARLLVALPGPAPVGAVVFVAVVGLAQPLPWTHYRATRKLETRAETYKLFVPIAKAFPAGPLRWYVQRFDQLQEWMHQRHVGTRHQEHKIFVRHQLERFPSRREGQKIRWADRHPVCTFRSVGVPGWTMPEVAIIDHHGLNDRVIAKNPVAHLPAVRLMAHERTPPPNYVECFAPNVVTSPAAVTVRPRPRPLDDDAIRACERRFWPD